MLKVQLKLKKNITLDDVQKLANDLEQFSSEIFLIYSNQQANCKSLINLLAIGILNINELVFKINGDDEIEVEKYLKHFLNTFNI